MCTCKSSNERKVIYTITTILVKDGEVLDMRTPAWYAKIEHAIKDVSENNCNICEFYYNFAVIEETLEGVYGTADSVERIFFEWNQDKKMYERCDDTPEWAEHRFGFGIG